MTYFFDGTKQAFLTAFLLAYEDGEAILTSGQKQLALGQETRFVVANEARAKKAEERLLSFDKGCMKELDLLLRSGNPRREQIAFLYFKLLAKEKRPVRKHYAEEAVMNAQECIRRIGTELDRMRGFVRFMECESGALYSPISPDNDICDLLVPHFRARLTGIPFIIHDIGRKKAAVYDGKNTFIAPLERAEIVLSLKETEWQSLWKRYYATVNIPSRERLRQMRAYMPVRYWKFLPELKP